MHRHFNRLFAVAISGTVERRGKTRWSSVHMTLHSDAFLIERKQASDEGKAINLSGFAVEQAKVKGRKHVIRLVHPVQHTLLLSELRARHRVEPAVCVTGFESADECGKWAAACQSVIQGAIVEQRHGLVSASKRKVDIRFVERFNVPNSETVIAEFACSINVVAKRSSRVEQFFLLSRLIKRRFRKSSTFKH